MFKVIILLLFVIYTLAQPVKEKTSHDIVQRSISDEREYYYGHGHHHQHRRKHHHRHRHSSEENYYPGGNYYNQGSFYPQNAGFGFNPNQGYGNYPYRGFTSGSIYGR
ncbi:hypothetical protein PVAND_017125 [Polypedilum vanderplanki]|uniref:Uncharacterized protein n=1 Tax=Polypedilum vanderplanki TaxID=319348 RepID=A0A9J6BH72_POLVA|nr:hypothetical protein PVAND_017125 [Polypedilum vanderplanki]